MPLPNPTAKSPSVVVEPSRQAARSDAARRALIDATITVLAEEGYRAATVARIQEVSGLSRGLVGYHFGSKQKLMEEVIESMQVTYHEALFRAQNEKQLNGLEQTLNLIAMYLTRLERDPRPAKVMLVLSMECVGDAPDIQRAMRGSFQRLRVSLRDRLQAGIEDGTVHPEIDPQAQAVILQAIMRGVVLQYLLDPKVVNLAEIKQAVLASIRRDLAP
jgi:AcrR family transcriptional regulator